MSNASRRPGVQASCLRLAVFSERGTRRDDVLPGLRVIGFERQVVIAFHMGAVRVMTDRVLYGGRNLGAVLSKA